MSDNINVEVKGKNSSIPPKNLRQLTAQVAEIEGTIDDINESVEEAEQDVNEIKTAIANSNDFTIRNGKMVRKNKRYAPAQYSGLGEIYLEKNETFLGREFDEFVVNVDVPDPTAIAETFDGLVYDRHRKEFLVYELVDGGRVYYAEWDKFNKWESTDDYIPEAGYDFICEADDKAYRWTEETTPDLIETVAHYGNVLKQEMVNFPNTIYHIQYDYDLNGKEITISEGCVLQFEGGSFKNGKLIGNKTRINSGYVKIFGENLLLDGTFVNKELYNAWFGIISDASLNQDTRWNAFFDSSCNTHCAMKVLYGEYAIHSPMELKNGMSLCGTKERPTLIYKGADETVMFTCGSAICLQDVLLERPYSTRHQCTAIQIGQSPNYSISSTYRRIKCTYFKIGFYIRYGWDNIFDNNVSTFNLIGYQLESTEFFISNINCAGNVVGIYIPKPTISSSSEAVVASINQGTIEGNGIGIIAECGYITLRGVYMEENKPFDGSGGTNEGLNYPEYTEGYEDGANLVCGKNDVYVNSFVLDSCYIGHSGGWSSLFDVDKCNSLTIISTLLEELHTTENTTVNNSGYIRQDKINGKLLFSAASEQAVSRFPILSTTDFTSDNIGSDGYRYMFGGGFVIWPSTNTYSFLKTKVADNKLKIYSSQRGYTSHFDIILESTLLKNGKYTVVLELYVGPSVTSLGVNEREGVQKSVTYQSFRINNKNLLVIELNKSGSSAVKDIYINNSDVGYVADDEDNGVQITGAYLYYGTPYDIGFVNYYKTLINDTKMSVVSDLLCIPNQEPSTTAYDIYPYRNDTPSIYFNNTDKRLLVKYNNVKYDAGGVKSNVSRHGTLSDRPSAGDIYIGFEYFCISGASIDGGTTEKPNIPIYYTGSGWVDANGNTVVAVS